jgi:hypothetical protein
VNIWAEQRVDDLVPNVRAKDFRDYDLFMGHEHDNCEVEKWRNGSSSLF